MQPALKPAPAAVASSGPDLGMLAWCAPEIRSACETAESHLTKHLENPTVGDTLVASARAAVHQAHGALAMLDVPGAQQLTAEIEGLLDRVLRGDLPFSAELASRIGGALIAVNEYLEELLRGAPVSALTLFPYLKSLLELRQAERIHPADLFFPPLVQWPAQPDGGKELDDEARHAIRVRFEKGLLGSLRNARDAQALSHMSSSVQGLAASTLVARSYTFWAVVAVYFRALVAGQLVLDARGKRLLARINLQLRQTLKDGSPASDRLLRDTLFSIAGGASDASELAPVFAAFSLAGQMPADVDKPRYGLIDKRALVDARSAIVGLKKHWEAMLSQPGGIVEHVGEFRAELTRFHDAIETIGVSGLEKLANGWVGVARHMSVDCGPVIDALGVEVATSLLFVEELFESGLSDFRDLPGRCAELVVRIDAILQGSAVSQKLPQWLCDLHATVQARLTMAAFIGELRSDLREAESALDNWHREPAESTESLTVAATKFAEIAGIMRLYEHRSAAAAASWLSGESARIAGGATPDDAAVMDLATSLGTLGFFIDSIVSDTSALPSFRFDAERGIFERDVNWQARSAVATASSAATPSVLVAAVARATTAAAGVTAAGNGQSTDPNATPASAISAEQVLSDRQQQLDDALVRWADAGQDESLRLEIAELLQNICDSAQLVDAAELLGNSQASIALAGNGVDNKGGMAARQVAERLGRPAKLLASGPATAPATVLPEAEQAIDEELLEIFLAEATEVLEAIASAERVLADSRDDVNTQTIIRRAFHTLKGSSRMVGLDSFGEAAWSLEQLMNLWLAEERRPTPGLLAVIADARVLFSDWVASLEAGAASSRRPDPTLVTARAEALRAEKSGANPSPSPSPISSAIAPAVDKDTGKPNGIAAIKLSTSPFAAIGDPVDEAEDTLTSALDDLASIEIGIDRPAVDDLSADDAVGFEFEIPDSAVESPVAELPVAELPAVSLSVPVAEPPVRIGEREIKAQLFRIFSEEATTLQQALLQDATDWQQQVTRKASDSARRAMHSLRGSAGLVQAEPARTLAASLERFLSLQIAATRPATADDITQYCHLVNELSASLGEFLQCQVPMARDEAIAAADALHARWLPGGAESTTAAATVEAVPAAATVPAVPDSNGAPVLQDEFDEELLPLFVAEAEEYLPGIDANLRAWLQDPDDAKVQQLIMRQLHTVKGSARMAGAMVLGQRVHDMESRVESAMALPSIPTSIIEQLMTEQDLVTEQFEYIRDPSLKSQVSSVAAAHEAYGQPLAVAATTEAPALSPKVLAPVAASLAHDAASDNPADVARQAQPLIRVRAEVLDKLVNEAGEITIARSRLDNSVGGLRQTMSELAENVGRLRAQLREIEMQGEMRIASSNKSSEQTTGEFAPLDFDPLEFDRFTRLQELTRMLAESVNDVATVHTNATRAIDEALGDLGRQGHTLRQLQHNLLGIRMVQFGTINDRLYRVVRQVAKAQGKRVSLDVRGATVQMDRGVLERMIAPLEHLLRNAVSHGIEDPARRAAAGKSETGDIRLEIGQEGNEIVLTLADDGNGLDVDAIRKRGVERGLLSATETPNDEVLGDLIFMPGFSTAKTVDQISGRGVGMDVVRSEVGLLGGRVQVGFTVGRGSRFTVHLPLTMAIEQVIMITLGASKYSLPAGSVEQVLQLDPSQLANAYEKRIVTWQDEALPLYWFASLVERGESQPLTQHHAPVMIVRSAGKRIAVHADAVSKAQEVVVKNVGPQVVKVPGVAGATVMGNGEVVLILNVGQLASRLSDSDQEAAMQVGMAAGLAAAPASVMVVDDSVTVRKVTQRFLAREGFDVLLAKDGVDALRQLEDRVPDVMLVDIEMPRMDGFDLTRQIRKDARFADIPIVMITSRTADKHRNFALTLGVNEYLGKPYDEAKLLGLVKGYVARPRGKSTH